jgi:hypothetical protein
LFSALACAFLLNMQAIDEGLRHRGDGPKYGFTAICIVLVMALLFGIAAGLAIGWLIHLQFV